MYQHFPNPNSMGNLKHGRFCLCSGDCICSWFGNTDMTPRELDEMKNLANAEQQNNNLFDVNETKETDKTQQKKEAEEEDEEEESEEEDTAEEEEALEAHQTNPYGGVGCSGAPW